MEQNELYRTQFIPVVLGAPRKVLRLSRRLFWRYGLSSHLFGERIPLWARLCPWVICHTLAASLSSPLTLVALTDLAAEIEAADRTPLLYLCDNLPDDMLTSLEASFILCREDDIPVGRKGERVL